MQSGAAKTELLGKGRQGRGGGKSRDAKNDIVTGIDLLLQIDFAPGQIDGRGGQIKVAAAGHLVGEQVASCQLQFLQPPILQSQVKNIMRMALDGQRGILEEGKILDRAWIRQIDEYGDAFAGLWGKDSGQQARQAEWRK